MKFVVLASGMGSTLETLLTMQVKGQLRSQVCALITDNPHSGALQIAARFGLPAQCINPKSYSEYASWDDALLTSLNQFNPDFILLAGFLRKVGPKVLGGFHNRIINTHPSLLPKFGGKGMYGSRVHEAVIAAKEAKTGITIHLLNEKFDEGPILKQVEVKVLPGDSAQTLEARVKNIEKEVLIEFLNSWHRE